MIAIGWLRRSLGLVPVMTTADVARLGEAVRAGFADGIAQAEADTAERGRPMTIHEFVAWAETDPGQRRMLAQARRIRDVAFPDDAQR